MPVADDLVPHGTRAVTESKIAEVVAAASAALGRPLAEPVSLRGGSDRSVVLRCLDSAGGTVVVKTYPKTGEGTSSFAAEAAGLELAGRTGLAPVLLAADLDLRVVVMSDLGRGATMADLLLGKSADAAGQAVLSWAAACGKLSAAASSRRHELAGLRSRYARGWPGRPFSETLAERIVAVADRAALLGVPAPAGLADDLADVAWAVRAGHYPVFSPGDLCPDNSLVTADGVRLLDFEAAAIYSVFLDAAYIRMPFSTCWCVFRLPAELGRAAELSYRQAICAAWPELADDTVWQPGVRRGIAAWTLNSMGWLLRISIEGDRPLDEDRTSPRARQLMRHRWQVLAAGLESAGELPALAELMRALLAATAHWQAAELPLYPAFRPW
jgi:hypothetical protein